jgi:hypothetical protein
MRGSRDLEGRGAPQTRRSGQGIEPARNAAGDPAVSVAMKNPFGSCRPPPATQRHSVPFRFA